MAPAAGTTVECPVCLRDVEVDANAREGDLIKCPICKIWFKLILVNGKWEAERVSV